MAAFHRRAAAGRNTEDALQRNKVLILDEPTSVLTPRRRENFFRTVRNMVRNGHGIISSRIKSEEIMGIGQAHDPQKRVKVATVPARHLEGDRRNDGRSSA